MKKSCQKLLGFMVAATSIALCLFASDGLCAAPAAPAITVTISGLSATISWNSVSGADGYTLLYAPYPAAAPTRSINMSSRTSLSVALGSGAAYYVAVKAYNDTGSSSYSNIEHFTITASGITVTDVDGNVYNTVIIGTQVWMQENLKVTKYRNGDAIGTTTPATLDIRAETSPKYLWSYSGVESNAAAYGRLYTWYAATDSRGLCPGGWHVPTDAEWTILTDYLGGVNVAGGKMKEAGTSHWLTPNAPTDNSSGFTALPAGSRGGDGAFFDASYDGRWWSATESYSTYAWYRSLDYYVGDVYRSDHSKDYGLSVRCARD